MNSEKIKMQNINYIKNKPIKHSIIRFESTTENKEILYSIWTF